MWQSGQEFEDGSADVHNELRYMFVLTQTLEGYEESLGHLEKTFSKLNTPVHFIEYFII